MKFAMDQVSQDNGQAFSVDITDIDSGGSVLYVLNGGTRPARPTVGHFAYDFLSGTFKVYYLNGWRKVTVMDVESLVRHPGGKGSVVGFTCGGLPFWNPVN